MRNEINSDTTDESKVSGVVLSPSAVAATANYVKENPEYQNKPLRLYLDGKGCDGFYYGVAFADQAPDDLVFESSGVKIIVDPDTMEFVEGSTITWVDDERGRGYLVENPIHRKFRGKFYKRKVWQERLEEKRKNSEVPT